MIGRSKPFPLAAAALLTFGAGTGARAAPAADIILYNGHVWTADDKQPEARAVAIAGNRIARVGSVKDVMSLRGKATQMIDVAGKLVVPGFIDAHTHFENATEWFYEAALGAVHDDDALAAEVTQVVKRVPKGMWITGGEWDRDVARKAAHGGGYTPFRPSLAKLDAVSPDHPVLIRRFDGAYFINSKGLGILHLDRLSPNPADGSFERDPKTGALTGLLLGHAGPKVETQLPPKSRAQTLVAARALLRDLNALGITGIHDISRVDGVSQTRLFPSAVERSFSDVGIFTDLKAANQLTVRVHPLLALNSAPDLARFGIKPGSGDDWIRYGGTKLMIDGSQMDAPFSNNPPERAGYAGDFAFRVTNGEDLQSQVIAADALGFDIGTHVLGDKAHRLLMNWYEKAAQVNPPRERRFRWIHAWFPAMAEIERAGRMHIIADITPQQMMDDIDTVAAKLGPERARTAYAWRTLLDHGVRLNIVSDWPGTYDKARPSPISPIENIYMAVARREPGSNRTENRRLDQALTVEEALRAYTINPAFSSREENVKGSISPGKLADIVVLSRDILKSTTEDILKAKVERTILDGRIIYTAPAHTPLEVLEPSAR